MFSYDKITHDDYVDGYTKLFKDTYANEYKKYLDDKGNFSEQEFLDSLVIEERYYKKKSGYVEELLESLGQLTIILPVVEGVLNREVFTEDRTTDDESAGKINNAMIQLFTLGQGAIASEGIGALRTLAVLVAGDVTATTISVTGERLKLPRGLTMAMAFIAANGVQNGMIKTFKTPGGRTIEIGNVESVADASKGGSNPNSIPEEFYKHNGGMDKADTISIHAEKHLYNPEVISTKKKTQFGKNIDILKLREDTMLHPDSIVYNDEQNVIKYVKEYDFNISTPDTPTGQHRVFINLSPKAGKTNRNSQFPLYTGGN